MWELLEQAADDLIDDAGLQRVDGVDTGLPQMGAAWSISGMIAIAAELGEAWPACADDLTPEIRDGLRGHRGQVLGRGQGRASSNAGWRSTRRWPGSSIRSTAWTSSSTASNPDVAFAADGPLPTTFGGVEAGAGNNGRLTFPANLHGNPAISIPAGRARRPARSGCRSSAATTPSRCCWSWPTSSSATGRGR